jgi:hypothetical protein
VNALVEDIRKIRSDFIRRSLIRLAERLSDGDIEDIADAAGSLANYFDWFKGDFAPNVRVQLVFQFETLREAAEQIGREFAARTPDPIPAAAAHRGKLHVLPRSI